MQALVWEAPRVLALRDYDRPTLQADEVLLKVAYVGICGSELSGYLGHSGLRTPPLVMGHEFSGEIVALGARAQADVPALHAGMHVTANPLQSCGACSLCRQGDAHLCARRVLIGAGRPGAYAEYVAVPARLVVPLPAGMALRTGALAEPVAVALRIAELAGRIDGQDALVIGAGPIGLLALQALRLRGPRRVFIADRDPARLHMGQTLGGVPIDARQADAGVVVRDQTDSLGVAVAVDAVGMASTRQQCIAATRAAGTVILSGLHEEVSTLPVADVIRREIVVRGSFAYAPDNFVAALQALADRSLRLDPWIVEAPLADGGQWFERLVAAPGNVAKVLLTPSASHSD